MRNTQEIVDKALYIFENDDGDWFDRELEQCFLQALGRLTMSETEALEVLNNIINDHKNYVTNNYIE